MPVAKKAFSIAPTNESKVRQTGANTIEGGFSFKQGQNTVRFSVPTSDRLLDVKSLHLTGQIILKTSNDNNYNNARGGNIDDDNGANLQRYTSANMPNFGGVHNCIEKVVIQSKKSNVELANINQYGLYASLKEAWTNNESDYVWGVLPNQGLAQGPAASSTNRLINLSANTTQAVLPIGSKHVGQHFSLKLDVDMLKSQNLHLGGSQLNGLLITLHLAPDSAVLSQRFKTIGANQTDASITNVMYVLKNLKLEGKYLIPTPQDLAAYQSKMLLNSRLNLVNDVHSDNSSKSYTPQLNNVKAIVNFFQDEDQTNNLSVQQNNCRLPQGIKEQEQGKDNVRTPLSYPVKFQPNPSSRLLSGTGALVVANLRDKSNIVDADIENRKQFEKAFLGKETKRCIATLKYLGQHQDDEYADLTPDANNGKGFNLRPDIRGVGVDYKFGLNNTVPYQNSDYSLNIKSLINTADSNVPTVRNEKSSTVNSFVEHLAVLSTNTLVRTM